MAVKKILNLHEEVTHRRLGDVCEKYHAVVFPKIRLADVFPIGNSGISHEEYRFALQSHFDFVISDNSHTPLFAVEFDGPAHNAPEQVVRDQLKDHLCERFDFPLLRINARYLPKKYKNLDLLSWFIEVWFFREAFFKAQETGSVPSDEPFDPFFVLTLPGRKERFPLWLSADIRIKIKQLAKSGKCLDFAPSEWIGEDDRGNYYGIIWLRINNEVGVFARSAMKSQRFPIVQSEILSELLVFQLYEELCAVLNGHIGAVPLMQIDDLVKSYADKYDMRSAGGIHLPKGILYKRT
jgi:hypothetical protein